MKRLAAPGPIFESGGYALDDGRRRVFRMMGRISRPALPSFPNICTLVADWCPPGSGGHIVLPLNATC